jgi:RNA polymerase sigma factor for flagellar operon FliA
VSSSDPYEQHANLIEQALAHVCRAHRLRADDAEEYKSFSRIKLLEDDRRRLRAYQGRSSMSTYLHTVCTCLFRDWRNHVWGKWRPSAEAERLGDLAVELEKLTSRDGLDYEQAVETLLSSRSAKSRGDCDDIWAKLKKRGSVVFEPLDDTLAPPSTPRSDLIARQEASQRSLQIRQVLLEALKTLSNQDLILVKLRYWSNFQIEVIAKRIGEGRPKRLYRQIDGIRRHLWEYMVQQGVTEQEIVDFFEDTGREFPPIFGDKKKRGDESV